MAVRCITERETGGVLQPRERFTKTGERFMEVLHTKHPEAHQKTAANLDSNSNHPPELIPVDITNNTVTAVAGRLSGGAGPGGTDSVRTSGTCRRGACQGATSRSRPRVSWSWSQGMGPGQRSSFVEWDYRL